MVAPSFRDRSSARLLVVEKLAPHYAFGSSMYDLFGHLLTGMEIGIWLAAGYYAQAIGLHTSDASVCAFLCSLTVVSEPETCRT